MGKPLRVVLGVHAHWTGSQWAAVENVLERALDVALECEARHGATCALDFDARGLEELAARSPSVLGRLRSAIGERRVELTGASYAQPSASLHGGESNLRQRVLGARALRRLLNCSVRAIWEGGPCVHPQLPQIIGAMGGEALGLVPASEEFSAVPPTESRARLTWNGPDGTRLSTFSASALSMAFDRGVFDAELQAALAGDEPAVLLAWVPLDGRAAEFWRRLDALRADPRVEYVPLAFSALAGDRSAEPRDGTVTYASDAFFHGDAPAKNGDILLRSVAWCEEQLLAAESTQALLGRLPGADHALAAWPAWELEESWRELCVAQHHSISSREERLAPVAECSIERSLALAQEVHERALFHLGRNVQGLEGGHLVLNPLGWTRDVLHDSGVARAVPAFGYRVVDPYALDTTPLGRVRVRENDDRIALVRGRLRVEIDRRRGVIEQISTREFPEGLLGQEGPLLDLSLVRGGREERFSEVEVTRASTEEEETDEVTIRRVARGGATLTIQVAIEPLFDAVWVRFQAEQLPEPDAGAGAGLRFALRPRLGADARLRVDHPYGVGAIEAHATRERRASVQTTVSPAADVLARSFSALRFVDISAADGKRGMLYVHDGSPSFTRVDGGVEHLLSSADPLEPGAFDGSLMADVWIVPHAGMDDAARVRLAAECTLGNPRFLQSTEIRGGGSLPESMGALDIKPAHVLATAFWREPPAAREHLNRPLGTPSETVFALRLVEFAGQAARVTVRVAGALRRAARTDPLGEVLQMLDVAPCSAVFGPADQAWSEITLDLRAAEIATLQFL